jgi:hypothetical protein
VRRKQCVSPPIPSSLPCSGLRFPSLRSTGQPLEVRETAIDLCTLAGVRVSERERTAERHGRFFPSLSVPFLLSQPTRIGCGE